MKSHEAKQRLQGVAPSLRGLTDSERAVLFEARADSARMRGMNQVSREYGIRAGEAAARARAQEAAQEAAHIAVEQARAVEVPIEVHRKTSGA